jgi:hypothetical protein
VIDVEQRALRAFEQQLVAALARCIEQRRNVGDHRPQRLRCSRPIERLLEVDGGCW